MYCLSAGLKQAHLQIAWEELNPTESKLLTKTILIFSKMLKISSAFISAALTISGIALVEGFNPNFVSAQACDASAFDDKDDWGSSQGFCSGTPSVYGVTVYKMGFCTSNPFTTAGVAVNYSSCTITYENSSGFPTSFAAGTTISLPSAGTSMPAVGSYKYAVIELGKIFDIAAEMGPFRDGTTYYSTSSWTAAGSPGKTTGSAEEFAAEMTSFDPNTSCLATSDPVSITGATLVGYLIDSSAALIADDTSVLNCSGVDKIVGVANLDTNVTITASTTGLTATFTVTNNGSSVYCGGSGGGCSNIHFDSGPFNVAFTVVE